VFSAHALIGRKASKLRFGLPSGTKQIAAVVLTVAAVALVLQAVDASELLRSLSRADPAAALTVVLLFVASGVVSAVRLHRSLAFFGAPVPFALSFRAAVAGLVSSLVVLGIFGALAGRQAVLRRAGVSAGTGALTVAVERAAVALVSGAACALAAAWLYVEDVVGDIAGRFSLVPLAAISVLVGLWHLRHASSHLERRLASVLVSAATVLRAAEMLLLAAVGQGLSVAAYVVAARSIGVDAGVGGLILAGAVVSFAASLPISVNGWGVREIAAVSAFGALGVAAEPATALSILVGLCATVAVVVLAPVLALRFRARVGAASAPVQLPRPDLDAVFAFLAAVSASILVFFQTHVFIFGAYISVNLADPVALLALAAAAVAAVSARARPAWLSSGLAAWFAATTLVLLCGFAVGIAKFGVTGWALNNRVVGWFVLLGYFCIGAAAAGSLGRHGVRRILETIVLVAAVIVLVYSIERLMPLFGFGEWPSSFDFAGYAANRNAFAFQLLVAASAALALCVASRRRPVRWLDAQAIALGLIVFGVWQTRSLAGAITGASILLVVGLLGEATRQMAVRGILWAFMFFALHEGVTWIGLWSPSSGGDIAFYTQPPALLRGTSLAERFLSIQQGIELWLAHPVVGAGLGAFHRLGLGSVISQLVIHSTPIWILAEFGLVGVFVVASYPMLRIFNWIRGVERERSVRGVFLVGLMVLFFLFSLAHEISYQRIFWLALGAAVGLTAVRRSPA
jgi:Lysylphosphatidylglycerol synthase TM region